MEALMNQKNGNNRPKVELGLNEEAVLRLLKDKCYEGSNSFGAFHLYSVEHEGLEKAFFAPAEVHEQIVGSNLKAGDEFVVRKVAAENGKQVGSRIEFRLLKKAEAASTAPGGTDGNQHVASDGLKAMMAQCVREAVEITKGISGVAWQNEDVQKISSCLFIARSRMN
jgi:hypothetical protein